MSALASLDDKSTELLCRNGLGPEEASSAECLAMDLREFMARRVGGNSVVQEAALCVALAYFISGDSKVGTEIMARTTADVTLISDLAQLEAVRRDVDL